VPLSGDHPGGFSIIEAFKKPLKCASAVGLFAALSLGGLLMTVDLGQIKKVKAAELWKHEEKEFTPWLAGEDNIGRLADALGLELQVEGIEVPVGPFSADILAKDPSDNFVVIENQFGKTDHDHLGKILTYAATLNATAVVWLAERFTDEHRKVMEWLNEHTSEDLALYAVEIEIFQIDTSKPALRFNVLSQPTEITRQATAIKSAGSITDTKKLQLEFSTMFRTQLLKEKVVSSAQMPHARYWFNISLGRSNIHLSCIANTWDGRIGVRVYIRNKVADLALPQLEAMKNEIEAEIGEPLKWNPNPNKLDKIIVLDRPANLDDHSQWNEYISWLVERVNKFRKAFGPRVKNLDLVQTESLTESIA
jgi:Domain of unknown function (DUF4268)